LLEVPVPGRFQLKSRVLVHPEHEQEFLRFVEVVERTGPRGIAALVLATVGLLPLLILLAAVLRTPTLVWFLFGIYALVFAWIIWGHPFATSQTVAWLGVQNSVKLIRALAGIIALAGAGLLLVPLLR
jgi:hypothetical protein